MAIAADTKAWTWVLERPCDQCGLDTRTVDPTTVAALIRECATQWCTALAGDDVVIRSHEDRWSTLEYGCHVRDVFVIFDERLRRMLCEDDPTFANWDQDATAVAERYADQDPAAVSAALRRAADRLADDLDDCATSQWSRPGGRSDGARFDVATLSRYLLHDPVHHLVDVGVAPRALGRPITST